MLPIQTRTNLILLFLISMTQVRVGNSQDLEGNWVGDFAETLKLWKNDERMKTVYSGISQSEEKTAIAEDTIKNTALKIKPNSQLTLRVASNSDLSTTFTGKYHIQKMGMANEIVFEIMPAGDSDSGKIKLSCKLKTVGKKRVLQVTPLRKGAFGFPIAFVAKELVAKSKS